MKLIFHIGQQKAGSTALQNALFENRHLFKKKNILYPKTPLPQVDHGCLSRMVFEEGRWPRQITKREYHDPGIVRTQARSVLHEIEEAAASGRFDTILLSSEYFFRELSAENKERLEDLLLRHFSSVVFVCYIRHPAPRYLSACLQKVRHAGAIPRPKRASFRSIIDSYAALSPVTVRAHDPAALTEGDIVEDFIQTFLPELTGMSLTESRRDNNSSLSPEIASILQEYRNSIYPEEDDRIYTTANRLRNTLIMIAERYGLERRAELKPAVARYIEEQSAEELDWLRTAYGVTFPGYTPAPETAPLSDPSRIRWIEDVCSVDEDVKRRLTAHVVHHFLDRRGPTRSSTVVSLLKKMHLLINSLLK